MAPGGALAVQAGQPCLLLEGDLEAQAPGARESSWPAGRHFAALCPLGDLSAAEDWLVAGCPEQHAVPGRSHWRERAVMDLLRGQDQGRAKLTRRHVAAGGPLARRVAWFV